MEGESDGIAETLGDMLMVTLPVGIIVGDSVTFSTVSGLLEPKVDGYVVLPAGAVVAGDTAGGSVDNTRVGDVVDSGIDSSLSVSFVRTFS